jgi:hypothetical protein
MPLLATRSVKQLHKSLIRIATESVETNLADFLTKPLPDQKIKIPHATHLHLILISLHHSKQSHC